LKDRLNEKKLSTSMSISTVNQNRAASFDFACFSEPANVCQFLIAR